MATAREIIDSSPDLKGLHEDGFEIGIRHAHLLVTSVPYVTAGLKVARGTLIFPLTMASDNTAGKPPDHTCYWAGDKPHYADGRPINGIINNDGIKPGETKKLADGIVAKFFFSSRPPNPDANYGDKVRRYVQVISDPARVIEPEATAQTRVIVVSEDDNSPLVYLDTNSGRAQITPITDKLRGLKIAIVGLGGTGSYVLDFVAKTPVEEIHLFDDDEFSLHNAYRAPGAPTTDDLRARKLKVNYLYEIYSRMHKRIKPHPVHVDESMLPEFDGMNFAFLCMEPCPGKAQLVEYLVKAGIPFVDTGLGIEAGPDKLIGAVNTITVTPKYKGHIHKIPVKSGSDDELYRSNIQIAELNALNAAAAVIRWKKHFGFYDERRHEHESTYTIGPNMLTNEETST